MATLQYDISGQLLSEDPSGQDVAIINGVTVPYITGSQFREYAATVYSESSFMGLVQQINPANPTGEMEKETFAIALTMYNYAMAKNAAFQRAGKSYGLGDLLKDSNYTKGISSPAHQEYYQTGGDEQRRRYATLAVVRIFTRAYQHLAPIEQQLQGGLYWDGNDLYRVYKNHFRAKYGFELSNPQQGALYQNVSVVQNTQVIESSPASNPNVSAKREYTYMSTMTAGGTIFWKIHPQAAAQGVTW